MSGQKAGPTPFETTRAHRISSQSVFLHWQTHYMYRNRSIDQMFSPLSGFKPNVQQHVKMLLWRQNGRVWGHTLYPILFSVKL